MRLRKKPYHFVCVAPGCGGVFFTVSVSMERRRRNRLPTLTSINGQITCTRCGRKQGYDEHVRIARGWRHRDENIIDTARQAEWSRQEPIY